MKTSEWVSLGHPDKMADYVSEYILDRLFERDEFTRYAVEVQLKDNTANLAGELTTRARINDKLLTTWVREAIAEIGYTSAYEAKWGSDNSPNAERFHCNINISAQSPDISCGVDNDGWGDQGIFFGMATREKATDYMPKDIFVARAIGTALYESGKCGLDIKTQVSIDDDGYPYEVIVAAPVKNEDKQREVEKIARFTCYSHTGYSPDRLIVNGTGVFKRHATIGDCGMTGRKLVVDFYGGNCEIGGGSPWTKDCTKADLTLNAYARSLALDYLKANREMPAVKCRISCCIGRSWIEIQYLDMQNNVLSATRGDALPSFIAKYLGLNQPCYARMCRIGLPYFVM